MPLEALTQKEEREMFAPFMRRVLHQFRPREGGVEMWPLRFIDPAYSTKEGPPGGSVFAAPGLTFDVTAMGQIRQAPRTAGVLRKLFGKERKGLLKPHVSLLEPHIPMFKGTEEALEFGKRASVEEVGELIRRRKGTTAAVDVLRGKKDLEGAWGKAIEGQFYREALEEWAVTSGAERVEAIGREAGGEMEGFLRELLHSPYVKDVLGRGLK